MVIQAIMDFALIHEDNLITLLLVFVNPHGLYARIATHLAMYLVIVFHLLLGLSRNCLKSKLSHGQAVMRVKVIC